MKQIIHVFIAHMGIGGAERVCVNLANEWAGRGHEVHIVVLNLDNDINTQNLAKDVQVHELGVSRLRYAAIPMLRYIKKYKPHHMLIFGNEMAVILSKLRKLGLVKTPLVVRVLNNVNIQLSKEDNVSKTVENYLNKAQVELSNMEHIVAQCEGMGRQLTEKGLVDPDKMTVIYNPVSEDLISKTNRVRTELSDGMTDSSLDRSIEILFNGRIDPQKNPAELISAFEMVHKARPDVRLRMVGSGNLESMVKDMVSSKGLTDYVTFDGIRTDMEQVYARASLVVLSSDYEGMPNCLIEAIGCGIPVVSYDCPLGPSEIIVDGVNGYLVKQGDTKTLAAKMIESLDRDWDRDAITATCDKFRVSLAATKYEEIFDRIYV